MSSEPGGHAAVIGGGAWGTALAHHLAAAGAPARLWAREPEVALAISRDHENPVFLPGHGLSPSLRATADLAEALDGAGLVVMVVPTQFYRQVLADAAPHIDAGATLVSCSKGIEEATGYTMLEVAEDVLAKPYHHRLACLSGPSFAAELTQGQPTAVTVASRAPEVAARVQRAFATPSLRVYTSADVTGVEVGGAVKNPLAIAAGMTAGLGLGHNTLAALITRGLAEMSRLAQARGGQLVTMSGLAGLGDLVLTCTSPQSRNYTVGHRLGRGESMAQISASMRAVAEGVRNTLTILDLARRAEVEMPIIEAVRRVIYEGMAPAEAVRQLMTRSLKPEHY